MNEGLQDRPVGVPTSPTGRVPQWVLDELTGRTADPPGWRASTPPHPPRRRSPALRGLLALLVVVALGLAAGVLLDEPPWPGPVSGGAGGGDRPTPGREAAAEPLGQPGAAPATGSHAFTAVQDDGVTPVAYDPCRPLHHVLAPAGAPAGAEVLVAEAVARLSAATGLRFVDDGTTDEAWSDQRPAYQPDRYGDRWAPVLVSWATPEQVPALGGTVAGIGGSRAVSAGGPLVYVTGAVTVDAGWTTAVLGSPGGRDAVLAVLVHELGHVLGLAHVDDPAELMSATNEGQVDLGPGDLAGLARLGRGPCEPRL
ncbi:Matrixin [Geodermatophilus saharensis]|uniref:Matrixin n=1 Tax=Geodermatophilus saharensis TaxID=1137994 RepID=A0A239HE36_9ACTN|nr:matrixin family metalloprotease [Geodermatophilus saharensis]SNS79610.1 Matrixin [Geodermatophilus saharensis]